MSFTHKFTQVWSAQRDSRNISNTQEFTAAGQQSIDESLAAATDTVGEKVSMALDVSELVLLYILSNVNITIRTNDDTTPTEIIVVRANEPLAYAKGGPHSNPFGADITADMYIRLTVPSTGPVAFKWEALVDPTP